MSPLNITQPIGIWSIMATIRWCPIFPKWDSYQPLYIHDGCLMFDVWSICVDVLTDIYLYIYTTHSLWVISSVTISPRLRSRCLSWSQSAAAKWQRFSRTPPAAGWSPQAASSLPWIAHAARKETTAGDVQRLNIDMGWYGYIKVLYIYIYMYVCMYVCIYVYVYIYIYTYIISIYSIHLSFRAPRTSVTASWAACDSAMVLVFLAFSSPRNLVASDKALPRRAMASERGQGPQERGCHLGRCHVTQNSMQYQCRHCNTIEIHPVLAGQNLNLIQLNLCIRAAVSMTEASGNIIVSQRCMS